MTDKCTTRHLPDLTDLFLLLQRSSRSKDQKSAIGGKYLCHAYNGNARWFLLALPAKIVKVKMLLYYYEIEGFCPHDSRALSSLQDLRDLGE